MYFDNAPCEVCGARIELRARGAVTGEADPDPVAEPDATVDERVCTNPDCPTNRS